MNEEPIPKSFSPPSSLPVGGDAQPSQQEISADDNKTSVSNTTFPKQNAWGIATGAATTQSNNGSNNAKKRSNVESIDTLNSGIITNESSKPTALADIMAEQQLEKNLTKPKTKVKFCNDVESEEERMMRLAIEASLKDHHQSNGGFISHAAKMPPSVLKNNDGTQNNNSNNVSFSNTNNTYDENYDMGDDMKMAIALSLKEGEASSAVTLDDGIGNVNEGKEEEEVEDDRKPPALAIQQDESKPTALDMKMEGGKQDNIEAAASANSAAVIPSVAASAATSSTSSTVDESERLARSLYQAELDEKSAKAAEEAASLQLALQLQEEEDGRNSLERDARFKREGMCHDGTGGNVGVRTVGRDEFNSLKNNREYGDGKIVNRRKKEESGMGKFLKKNYGEEDETLTDFTGTNQDDTDYYYYEHDRYKGDDDLEEEDDIDDGIRMNSRSSSSSWKRLDKDTFVGPNNEIRTKHDPELKHRSNAVNLLGSQGAKLKDAYSGSNKKSASISDRAYNAFRTAETRQTGYKKGVRRQGHGRAEDMNAGKTRGGALDGNVRLQIAAAINIGLIETCNGVVKEGKEALVYHAYAGSEKGRQSSVESLSPETELDSVGSDGYDVAVKVFKRIVEFKGRGSYVDGDPRYHKQKFKTNDQREQVTIWTTKEYRNLIRAHRAGVAVPKPLHQKENVLFMRFLGDNGWPSPQLREVEIKKGSDKWTTFYCQTLLAVRRLYHFARLIHSDLSEYNILVSPKWQTSHDYMTAPDERTADDETLQVVLIDFGQAVDTSHPSAKQYLKRDLSIVRDFFTKQGIKTLSNDAAEEYVIDDSFKEVNGNTETMEAISEEATATGIEEKQGHQLWDDEKELEALLKKLKENS